MMDPNDAAVPSSGFTEEEKLPDGIDEDSNWFGKNLGDESDNTVEHEVLNSQINQDTLDVELDNVKDSDLEDDKVDTKPAETPTNMESVLEMAVMESDSQSELLADISDGSLEKHQVTLEQKKDELTELKDIAIDGKKHDISNELKEMFEEKSSDAEELQETSLTKHSLDTDITKEDKLKDIVPDDILGKDDSFDELDNDALHQELEAHLTYEKSKELMSDLPDSSDDLHDEVSAPHVKDSEHDENEPKLQTEPEISKSLEDLNSDLKSELLKDITENIGTKEIDDIMEQDIQSEEDSSSKDLSSDLKEISSSLEESCVNELEDDLENQLQNITGESVEELPTEQESTIAATEEIVNQVDKSSIELDKENMMVEFAHDSGNQVLIQINTDQTEILNEESEKSEPLLIETSDCQTLVFSAETMETGSSESEMVSQVEGGAEFLQAVTGKLEDVLMAVKDEPQKEETLTSEKPAIPAVQPVSAPAISTKEVIKEESPKCCVTTCKSGKSSLKTTYRYFKPPVNKILYKKWEYIFLQARQQITPNSLICELHFRTGLIYKKGVDRNGKVIWALREGALPKLSPSGVLRVTGGVIPPPSTTVQVPKKPEGIIKTPLVKPVTPVIETKAAGPNVTSVSPVTTTPKVLTKKILQKPVKTVATKVSNEVTDIGFLYKNPELVKAAQNEITNLDVLVCGECHSVFHILELFQAHKMADNCKGESNFQGNPSEPKPQVWAFLLWKSAQAKVSDMESSWRLYTRWCKLDERIRSVWVAAGKFLQEGNTVASLKLFDVKLNKLGRPPIKDKDSDDEEFTVRKAKRAKTSAVVTSITPAPEIEPDVGGAGDAEPMEVEPTYVPPPKPVVKSREIEQTLDDLSRHTPELITSEVEIKQEIMSDEEHGENKENDNDARLNKESDEVQNCSKCKEQISNPKGAIICAARCYGYFHVECTRVKTLKKLSKMGVKKMTWKCDSCKLKDLAQSVEKIKPQPLPVVLEKPSVIEKEEEEFVVEKIVSRRYNIKKKHFEYLLKWEGYPSEQNTWEPAENLGTCQHLLKAFEEALAKQQAAKLAANNKQAPIVKQEPVYKVKPPIIPKRKPDPSTPGPSTPIVNSTGRPVRSSKQKAMDQVKVWCGSIVKPSEDDNVGLKRKASSDSEYEEEVVVKRVKVEVESDDSDISSVKKVEKATPSRGRGRPFGSTNASKLTANKLVVNGDQKESNLAAALGLESDEEEEKTSPTLQKSSVVRKMSSLSPHNQQVLVASAKGVVTVDPKQVPNLSSGVYIMSNKSGIVKVDNNKTLSTLQKSGVLKKPISSPQKVETEAASSPKASGVVVLPRSEAGSTSQQKLGVIRKGPGPPPAPTSTTPAPVGSTPARPPGLLKPMRPGVTPRPLGLLKPPTSASTPGMAVSPTTPPPLAPLSTSNRPLGIPAGINTKIQNVVRPRNTIPLRGRTVTNPLLKRPVPESPSLQASPQQKLLIAQKKAETEGSETGVPVKPTITISSAKKVTDSPVPAVEESKITLVRSKVESNIPTIPPIKSTNKVFAHPLLNRGRGRGNYRGRGRGSSLGQLLQVTPRELPTEPVKESKLVESDNLLMEFQEPSESEESDDGLDDMFPNIADLPPIVPDSPPRPLTLCPLTGKVLSKAEGEKTPEPTPPPSPKPPTPPPVKVEEPTHILPDHEDEVETEAEIIGAPMPVAVTAVSPRTAPTTTVVKQDGMICKVEMSPGGTTGTLVEAVSAASATPPGVTEGTVTIKKPLASRNRINRGPQLSVMPTNSSSTSIGTITVPARKLFHEENGEDDVVTLAGDDGLIYQVSNSELVPNTLLVSSAEDGQQQCVYVTTDAEGNEDGSTILTLDTAYADAVAQLSSDQVNILSTENGDQFYIKEGEEGDQLMTLEGEDGIVDDQNGQVVAQLVEAGEPAPGGSRRVVLLLPDGNLMMTEVDEEQYAALDLDK